MALLHPRLIIAAVLMIVLVAPSAAPAFNDSPTFALEQGDVKYPLGQATVKTAIKLNRLLAALREDGLTIKIALAEGPQDFGAVPEYFEHPQRYADYLYGFLLPKGRPAPKPAPVLLVVTPNGIGVRGASGAMRALVRTVPIDSFADAEELARAAGVAAQRLGRDSGREITTAFETSDSFKRSRPAVRTALLATLALTAIGVGAGIRSRPRSGAEPGLP